MSHSRIAQELSLFSNCSYLGRFGTESWSNNFAGRSIEFINIGIDIPAIDWYRNIWSTRNGPVLLEAMEGFGHHVLWHSGLLLRLIRKYHGIAESNATSNNIKMVPAQLKHEWQWHIQNSADHEWNFFFWQRMRVESFRVCSSSEVKSLLSNTEAFFMVAINISKGHSNNLNHDIL